jgi:hypothetical protein
MEFANFQWIMAIFLFILGFQEMQDGFYFEARGGFFFRWILRLKAIENMGLRAVESIG